MSANVKKRQQMLIGGGYFANDKIVSIVKLLRPAHYFKNVLLFFPLFFGQQIFDIQKLSNSLICFFCLCFAASSIYCFNDIVDCEADKKHPVKCKRPVASGTISKPTAYIIMSVMFICSALLALFGFGRAAPLPVGIILLYYLMNISYSLWLKHFVLIDVFTIALGFVLRVVLGGIVTDVALSEWIIVMTFSLALFLTFAKRRDDILIYEETGIAQRKNVKRYNLDFMNQVVTLMAAITIVGYLMYSISPSTTGRFGNHAYITTIFVLMGIIRYLQIAIVSKQSGSPTSILLKDRYVQFSIAAWLAAFVVIIYVL
jgi:4-hydroxybenzoate polyprenyltransferase